MIHHYLTKYVTEKGEMIAEAWIQLNIFGKCFIFSDRKTAFKKPSEDD